MHWMVLPLRRYAQFSGRSRRKEYWMFVLFTIIVSAVASIIDYALGFGRLETTRSAAGMTAAFRNNGPVSAILGLALLLPSIAVSVRRLHDIDRTGWWVLAPLGLLVIGFIVIATAAIAPNSGFAIAGAVLGMILMVGVLIVGIVLLVFACLDGTPGTNRFGPDPKGTSEDELAARFS
jgi:uncharacterized membrane protein YhaH (DUF805 family)